MSVKYLNMPASILFLKLNKGLMCVLRYNLGTRIVSNKKNINFLLIQL